MKKRIVAAVEPSQRDAHIIAANVPGAIGVELKAFWDQFSWSYVETGPVAAPDGTAYMVYVSR